MLNPPSPALDTQTATTLPELPESALYPLQSGPAPGALPEAGQAPGEPVIPLKTWLRQQELVHLNRAIRQCDGDKEQAALSLGISIATLYRRLAEEDEQP